MADPVTPEAHGRGRLAASTLRGLLRPPHRGPALAVVIGAPILAGICWYFGSDVSHAIAIALSIAAIGIIWAPASGDEEPAWPRPTENSKPGRREVTELSWWLRSRRGRVDDAALRRVRALASNRLATRGLELADPSHRAPIERLIGAEAYATLLANWQRPPSLRSVIRCLDALDTLDRRIL